MKIISCAFIALCAAALAGCSTIVVPSRDSIMDSWVGHSREELTAHWGEPTSEFKTREGMVVLTWEDDWDSCTQMFTVDRSGEVVEWRHKNCPAT